MNIAQIKESIRQWILDNKDASILSVVYAQQNAPRPAKPYITLLVTPVTRKEHAHISAPNSSGEAIIENEAEIVASVQCYGDNALSLLDSLRNTLEKQTVRDALRGAGTPYIRTLNGVSDLTEQVGTNYEPRAGVDLEFRAVITVTDTVGVIEEVHGTATHEINSNSSDNYENDFVIGA